MRFFAITSALLGAAMASNELEARWKVTSSSSVATASASCVPVTTTCTVTVTAWGAKNTTAATGYYVNGADSITYGAWSVVAGMAAAMLL